MLKQHYRLWIFFNLLFLLFFSENSFSVTATGTMSVSLVTPASCSVSATNLNFGTVTAVNSIPQTDATSTISAKCTNTTTYTIALDTGSHPNGTQRRLASGISNSVNYNLYSDISRTLPWGNIAGQIVSATGTGLTQNYTVYGRIPSQSFTGNAGTYTDTVNVTVTY